MDFKSMPVSKDYNIVFIIINRFSKQAISQPCYKTVTTEDMAWFYIRDIYRYQGPPESIVSDRGPQFVSNFWKKFYKNLNIKLKFSTAFHP